MGQAFDRYVANYAALDPQLRAPIADVEEGLAAELLKAPADQISPELRKRLTFLVSLWKQLAGMV